MSEYNSKQYLMNLSKGEVAEEELARLLKELGYNPVKNITRDKNGNTTWQQIIIRGDPKRNLDYDVFSNSKSLLFKAEVKQLTNKYSNSKTKEDDVFLSIEKAKLDDYIFVQQETEEDCFVFFLVGEISNGNFINGYVLYWESLQNVWDSIVREGDIYRTGNICYVLDASRYKDKYELWTLLFDY